MKTWELEHGAMEKDALLWCLMLLSKETVSASKLYRISAVGALWSFTSLTHATCCCSGDNPCCWSLPAWNATEILQKCFEARPVWRSDSEWSRSDPVLDVQSGLRGYAPPGQTLVPSETWVQINKPTQLLGAVLTVQSNRLSFEKQHL